MPLPNFLLPALLALCLAACGGGSSSPTTSGASTTTVTPALGKVQGATVNVYTLQGSHIGVGGLGTAGSVSFPSADLPSAVVLRLVAGSGSYYFDEALGAIRQLPDGYELYAVSLDSRRPLTITVLTEIIFRRALALSGTGQVTAATVTQAEAEVAAVFGAPPSGSFLDVPERVAGPLDLPDAASDAGRHALQLAAWAQLALDRQLTVQPDCASDPACTPLLDLIAVVGADFADGSLDGLQGSTPLDSHFYAAAGSNTPANLQAALQAAATAFTARVQTARAAGPVTDTLLGSALAGRYPLSCNLELPAASSVAEPMQLTIGADGGFSVEGPFGRFTLAAGSSFAWLQELASGTPGFGRSGVVVTATSTTLGASPLSDGLSLTLTPPPPINLEDQLAAAGHFADGSGFVYFHGRRWNCNGVPALTTRRLTAPARIAAWLPAGDYQCERAGPEDLVTAAVTGSVLSIGGSAWDMSTATLAESLQQEPLTATVLTLAHAHSGDAVAQTLAPLVSLRLTAQPGTAGNDVQVHRSLVNGNRFFDAILDGVLYQHCQAATDL